MAKDITGILSSDEHPRRMPAVRRISGVYDNGMEVRATAKAQPLPDSLGYGPFVGEGDVTVSRGGYTIVSRINFDEIDALVDILRDIQREAAK